MSAAYASCRLYRTTTQCSLSAGDQPLPNGSAYPSGIYCTFLHVTFHLPSTLGLSCRDAVKTPPAEPLSPIQQQYQPQTKPLDKRRPNAHLCRPPSYSHPRSSAVPSAVKTPPHFSFRPFSAFLVSPPPHPWVGFAIRGVNSPVISSWSFCLWSVCRRDADPHEIERQRTRDK